LPLPNRVQFGYFAGMKRLAALAILLLTFSLSPVRAQNSADDQYVVIYSYIQQADSYYGSGQPRDALKAYAEAQGELQKFQKVYPDWNPNIVNYRLNYLSEKITELTPQVPVPPSAPPPVTNAIPSSAASADFQAQLGALQAQVQNLSANNTTLEAKLKEALSAQPTMVDSRELAKAQDQIRELMKEDDLLKTSLAENHAEKIVVVDTNAIAQAQADLAAVNKKLTDESARADKLADENSALQSRIKDFLASSEAMDALRAENALLKKQLAESQLAATNQPALADLTNELAKSQLKISILQSNADVAALEKTALEQRVRQLQSMTNAPFASPAQAENEARLRDLTQERDNLLAKLDAANKKLYGSRQDVAAQISQLTDEISTLRARLSVDEAPSVPYTPEELALLNQPKPLRANPDAEKKSIAEMPSGTATLVAEAQNHFAAREYDKAEDDYQQILQHDQNNGLALANLATIELQQDKLDDAEKHIKAALMQSPDDAYNLSILGYLKFRQEKYDDALDALSRAAKLDPRNPEIQNYLGVTLDHKGLRTQAEAALRKAIQLDPNYAAAHNNLAVIYLNEQPPLIELARWHYQKALDAGQPHNPELEKELSDKGAPVNP
jgi:cytochrome c-type biogenesis protein CcmH/NrfG